jgi:hypothetical protein
MSTGYQAAQALGTNGECRLGKVRHTVTIDKNVFEVLRSSAMANRRSISEEIATRLAREVQIADPGA